MAEDGKINIDKFDGVTIRIFRVGYVSLDVLIVNVDEVVRLEGFVMKEGASIADHVNELNSILSRLMSVDIKFDDEVQALLLLSLLPESWKTSVEYLNSLLSAKDKGRGRKQDRGQKQNRSRSKSKKRGLKKRLISIGKLDEEWYHMKVSFVKIGNFGKLQRLELVHTDVYGPTSITLIGRPAIDDNIRNVWVYFLKSKSEVFNTFKKWKATVENETNLRVKYLKSNNGGEYISQEFIEYCSKNGIRMLKTVPETPHQNSVAERMNQTLNEREKSMRLHAGLLKMLELH
nr:retrovirus-related Pol polyprotein from transposon TNT 1-94 [Tanacetum cinerariifolium]